MSFDTLLPLIKKTGSPLSAAEFQNTVNVVFHDAESAHYDAMHADMWESLQQQINLLSADVAGKLKPDMHMLDIGCGTGLSTQLLLNSSIGKSIKSVTLLDTSPKMLEHASERSKSWGKDVRTFIGDAASLHGTFDVIIICSVLHHIPDLGNFLKEVGRLQNPGGILIHLQDPNGDFMNDAGFIERIGKYDTETVSERKPRPGSVLKSAKKFINKILGRKTYMDRVNDRLIEMKVIKKRMTSEEIWSVTDIHVENLPFSTGQGISIKSLMEKLSGYTLVNTRSYGFFGPLKSELPLRYQHQEQQFIDLGKKDGRNVSAVWIKK